MLRDSQAASAVADEEPPIPLESAGPQPGWVGPQPERPMFRRRNLLVDKRSQLQTVAMVGLFTMALLVPVNLGLHVVRSWTTAEMVTHSPQLRRVLDERSRVEGRRVLIGSGIVVLAIMAITVLRTHRTAGAAYKLRMNIAKLREGRYGVRTVLRKGDRLRGMERELNDLSQVLLERSEQIAVDLEQAASAADQAAGPDDAQAVGDRLRQMAAQQRLNRAV